MARKPLLSGKDLEDIVKNSPHKMCDKHQLVSKYEISEKTAERTMKKLGLVQTSSANIECIMRYLGGEKVVDLAKEYGMSQVNLNALMRFRDIEQRGTQHFCDFHYFDEIDTEDKAYFLGFIYADGNLFKNSLKISIRDYDVDVLEKMKFFMLSNHPIYEKVAVGFSKYEELDEAKEEKMVEVIITNPPIREAMLKHGVVEAKTHKLDSIPATVPEELLRHFVRGYIDGDGSFGAYRHNDGAIRYSLNLIGTIPFLNDFSEKVEKLSGIPFNQKLYDRYPKRKTNTRALSMSGKGNVLALLDWLYDDASVWMDRKRENYLRMKTQ